MKRYFALFLCLVLLLSAVACNGGGTAEGTTTESGAATTTDAATTLGGEEETTTEGEEITTEPPEKTYEGVYPVVEAGEKYSNRVLNGTDDEVFHRVKADGRSYMTEKGISIDWSASALEFQADCKGDLTVNLYASGGAVKFRAFLDGEELGDDMFTIGGSGSITFPDLEEGTHTIRILRITMVESGTKGVFGDLTSIDLNGVLMEKPADKAYYIEFLGDSVSCGVGTRPADGYAYGDEAFPYQTAVALDVDYSVVSISGIGTMTGTSRHGSNNIYGTINWFNYYRSPKMQYETDRQADVVVIATNANDHDQYGFDSCVRAIVNRMRDIHGDDTKFIWVFNMYNDKAAYNQIVINEFERFGGEEAGFYTLEFFVNKVGGSEHPIGTAHDDYTELLVNFIQEKNILG
ncbi:MAG: hypothetical protein IJY42_03575 [Clostridia bacterium]|nr:hypothetical protein [Clostridia bacterium]